MNLKELQNNWNTFGKKDPFWAIVTWPDKKGCKWRPNEFFENGTNEIYSIMAYVRSLGINIQRKKALDFGCGAGRVTQALVDYFDEVIGVDIAPSMLKLAQKYNRFGGRCKYYLNETENLTLFDDNAFDFVYSCLVLQHMRPQYSKGYIRELIRVVAPGGILIFQLPSERSGKPFPIESNIQGIQGKQPKAITKIKQFVKVVSPRPLLKVYYDLRYGEPDPIMEMYSVKQEEVLQVITESGGKILDLVQDEAAGPNWISFRYCVTKA